MLVYWVDSIGRRNARVRGGCDGQAEGVGSDSDGAAGGAFAGVPGLTTSHLTPAGVDAVADSLISPPSALVAPKPGPLRPRQQPVKGQSTACGLSDLRLRNLLADRTSQLPTVRDHLTHLIKNHF
jgi:hypothetical protein